jgi:hypothetical protein
MREFVVTLRSGLRITVRAHRMDLLASGHLALVVDQEREIGDFQSLSGAVALFEGHQVLNVISKEHLVAEERYDPGTDPDVIASPPGDEIPF